MPPHLSRGAARQQRRIIVPSPVWFCSCSECIEHPCYNPLTHKIQNGQYIAENLFRLHSRREGQRTVARANYIAEAELQSLPTQPQVEIISGARSAVDNPYQTIPEETIPMPSRKILRRKKLSRPLPQLSTQLRELADSLSVINSDSFRDGFQRHPAVFVHPPQPHEPSIEVPNFELDPYASPNHAFLQYERSLREASDFLRRSSGPGNLSRIDLLRLTRLKTQVSEEQDRASKLKKDLWQHQRSISQKIEKIVDTGLLFVFPLVPFTADLSIRHFQIDTCRLRCAVI